jgi:hypothetical protein
MPENKLFYVTVEEVSQITLAIEAEDADAAQDVGLDYVGDSVFLEDLTVTSRTAEARPADVHVALKDCVKPMTRGVDPVADARDHLRKALKDISSPECIPNKQEALDLARAVLEEFAQEAKAKRPKMGL